jgi:myo-inositol 2-dehydrogenase/D-chiro-inositol 1-dehydrogenase
LPLAVIGAGMMARRRLAALLATDGFHLCGVVARRRERAQALADAFGGAPAFDDHRALAAVAPRAVLLEVPHNVQDGIAAWVVDQGWHLLVGGPLATTEAAGRALAEAAAARGVVVEAGFEARYKPVWETAKTFIETATLGQLVAVTAVALWRADPARWYYDEAASGGMPLTHMTYCFINPLRWLLGEPSSVAAISNQLVNRAASAVHEETCIALLRFPGDVVASLTAGYVRSAESGSWQVTLFGSDATLEIFPDEMGPGRLCLLRGDAREDHGFPSQEDGFRRQAHAFLDAIGGVPACRNRPQDCLGDLRVTDAIRRSARDRAMIACYSNDP